MARHKWSVISVGTTVFVAVLLFATVSFLHHRGQWNPNSRLAGGLSFLGGSAMLVSLVTAFVAIVKEEPVFYGLAALCLSLLSFFLYVR